MVNQFTGDLFGEKTTVPFGAAHVLPFTTVEGADAVLIVASNGTARAFPSESTPGLLASRSTVVIAVDQTANEVRGYALRRTDDDGIDSVHSWTVSFPPEAGSIVGFASKPNEDERVNSWASASSDRSAALQIPQSQHRVSRHERWEARASDAHRRCDGKNLIPRSSR